MLDPLQFVRVRRLAAVNTERIHELQTLSHAEYTLVLTSGTELRLSRNCRIELEQRLHQTL